MAVPPLPRPSQSRGNWATPIKPLERNEMWCVWDYGGMYEWMVHPDYAKDLVVTGIKVDGEWCPVEVVGEWPNINATQIRAVRQRKEPDVYPMTAAA